MGQPRQVQANSEYWLGLQGRIGEPMYQAADSDQYRPILRDDEPGARAPRPAGRSHSSAVD
ncbi:hypothetical protein [Gordonia sp. (in: high G+C Gram-positive bacteria)]|uniref:hypothetical protein n=1 Tax=Gordonia sp. (in: high G+C Gram-positive bacteria) TaxID=84139 RepID=UPI003F9BE21A